MSKAFELEQLRKQLMNPELPSGLYLLDTLTIFQGILDLFELYCAYYHISLCSRGLLNFDIIFFDRWRFF